MIKTHKLYNKITIEIKKLNTGMNFDNILFNNQKT